MTRHELVHRTGSWRFRTSMNATLMIMWTHRSCASYLPLNPSPASHTFSSARLHVTACGCCGCRQRPESVSDRWRAVLTLPRRVLPTCRQLSDDDTTYWFHPPVLPIPHLSPYLSFLPHPCPRHPALARSLSLSSHPGRKWKQLSGTLERSNSGSSIFSAWFLVCVRFVSLRSRPDEGCWWW